MTLAELQQKRDLALAQFRKWKDRRADAEFPAARTFAGARMRLWGMEVESLERRIAAHTPALKPRRAAPARTGGNRTQGRPDPATCPCAWCAKQRTDS